MTDFLSTGRGDRVACDHEGLGAPGPGVVFIAGAGPSRADDQVTTDTARLIAGRGVETLVFDRLGRNESRAEGTLDLDRELSAVAAALAATGGRALLVGHSSGCAIALAAADRGLPVAGLVLWEAPIAGDPERTGEWAEGFLERIDAGRLEEAQEWFMRDMPPEWLEGARNSPAWPAIYAGTPNLRADIEALRWADAADPSERFSRVRVPVLILAGAQTEPVMLSSSELVTRAIPSARAERIAGAGHSWEVDAMGERLLAAVERLRRGAQEL